MSALLALAMTGFICIVTETLPAGLLPQMADSLHISASMAGQTVTAYALGSVLTVIPLAIATQGWQRRNVLLLTVIGFLLFNTVTALSSSFWTILIARFCAGMAAGLAWSLLAGYARRMVPVRLQGRALAVAMVGTPIALSLGVPLGTWLGALLGWRIVFGILSALAVILIVWVSAKVPNYLGQATSEQLSLRAVAAIPGVRGVLGVVLAWMLAHNLLYTYIAPFVAQAGSAVRLDTVLLAFGVAALVAIGLVGRLVDQHLRASVLLSLAVFAGVALIFVWQVREPMVVYLGVVVWGLTFGGAATLLQTALADAAAESADVALSMNVVVWNSAIAGGGVLGGILLDNWGISSIAPAAFCLAAIGLWMAWHARAHAFRPGWRHARLLSVTGH